MTAATEAGLKTALAPRQQMLVLALLLALASLPLAAQAPQQPEPESTEEQATEAAEPTLEEPALDEPALGEATPAESDDPFDYEASEQISEDLSVSFPVDI